jgi:hypothetical protein
MTTTDPWTFVQHQAEELTARARRDDRPARPSLLARLAAWAAADRPTAHDHQLAELVWAQDGDGRAWAELGTWAHSRLARRAMPYRRALVAAQQDGAAS